MDFLPELAKCFFPSHDAFIFMWCLAVIGIIGALITLERWLAIGAYSDYDALALFDKVKKLVYEKNIDGAYQVCAAGGKRALPRILASGIKKSKESPELVMGAMSEESTHMNAALERHLGIMVMFGNVSTLFGLLGTVFGLIMSFSAVSQPNIEATEKSALLAAGISAAMNSTLVGLTISVLCVVAYAFLRARVDAVLVEIDRYAVAILNILNPPEFNQKKQITLTRRSSGEEEAADADVTPMLNLMVILIPVLLTSSEFVKIGSIELKLPEASGGGGGGSSVAALETKLEVGVVITAKGFNLFHYYKTEASKAGSQAPGEPDIPLLSDGKYDLEALNKALCEVKRKALYEIDKAYFTVGPDATLIELYKAYISKDLSGSTTFPDNESIKIVAEEKIKYQTVVAVMDAARGAKTDGGVVTLFPNVSIAGGIVQ